jgi:hypothetical protein
VPLATAQVWSQAYFPILADPPEAVAEFTRDTKVDSSHGAEFVAVGELGVAVAARPTPVQALKVLLAVELSVCPSPGKNQTSDWYAGPLPHVPSSDATTVTFSV